MICALIWCADLSEADKAQLLARWNAADGECCICMDAPGGDVAVLTRCGHGPMCRECIEGHLQSQVCMHFHMTKQVTLAGALMNVYVVPLWSGPRACSVICYV